MIELRSDTFTKPTKEMLAKMFSASVGDDVWDEDFQLREALAKILALVDEE